jgi:branched-subunit amino acid aminotransferase/4-amino-4-deoxychorismate lyase
MLSFLKFGKRMPQWLGVEAKDRSRSCQKAVERTMKAMKKLMLTEEQSKQFFQVELHYQRDKKSVREMYFHLPDVRHEELLNISEIRLKSMQAFLDANQWAVYRVESI